MIAALRILAEAATYRLGRLEMANIFAGLTIAVALGMSSFETLVRVLFLFLLNVLALLGNDCFDVDQDVVSRHRDPAKPSFLKAHMKEAVAAQIALGLALAAFALFWSRGLLIVFVLGEGNCLLYSWRLKRVAFLDVLSIALWGLVMPAACFPLDSALGWCLSLQLFFFSATFELMQVMRDREEDLRHGVTTTAVRLGHRGSVLFLRIVLMASAAYGILFIHRFVGIGILAALLLPVRQGDEARAWTRLRVVLGLVWLVLVGWILVKGETYGLVTGVSVEDTIAWMTVVR
ncbi:MAG: UbiA family prenyltransferase [Deltaproteobacteria bacterium]|nr:UbiA family prenyltransferase [Deltaproteobacteria bacterium]